MDCPECSGEVEPTQRFCNWCGTPLTGDAANRATPPRGVARKPSTPDELAATQLLSEVDTPPSGTEGQATSDASNSGDDADESDSDEGRDATDAEDDDDETPAEVGAGPDGRVLLPPPAGAGADAVWSRDGGTPHVASAAPTPLEFPDATPPSMPYVVPTVQEATPTPTPTATMPVTAVAPAGSATVVLPPVQLYNDDPDPGPSYDTDDHHFRLSPLLFVGVVGAVLAVVSMFSNMVEISSDVPIDAAADNPFGFQVGVWQAIDLGGNLPIAGIIVAAGMVVGATAAAYGQRWGAGLAGGSGAAAAGVALLTVGVAQYPIDAAHQMIAVPSAQEYVLSITRDVGYWLQVATAAAGLVVLWASLSQARTDHRRNLNPWIAAFGALATLVAAVGPMMPVRQGLFSDNWYLVDAIGQPSQLLVIARLVQIALFLITGVVGFLIVSRYGLGMVFGGTLAAVWLTVSTALKLTARPVGFAFRNPGAVTMGVNGVTIFGMAATLAAGLIACAGAIQLSSRGR